MVVDTAAARGWRTGAHQTRPRGALGQEHYLDASRLTQQLLAARGPQNGKRRGLIQDRYHASKLPEDVDYVVIGAGMSGLTTASLLSRVGYKVVVVEQHDRCGGGSHTYELGYV